MYRAKKWWICYRNFITTDGVQDASNTDRRAPHLPASRRAVDKGRKTSNRRFHFAPISGGNALVNTGFPLVDSAASEPP